MTSELDFSNWIGKVEEAEDSVSVFAATVLAATLNMDAEARGAACLVEGGPLPPLWHWIAFLPNSPMSRLGPDGHPERGGFLPPVPLERRMWAGGRLRFHDTIRIGERILKRSEITAVTEKTGATGRMVFVTVEHSLYSERGLALTDSQDIVYAPMPERFTPPPPVPAPEDPAWTESVPMDTVRLFRFSAVTFNAHRIHFDLPYATEVEKYPGLVVHGPLQAILLMEAVRRQRGGAWPSRYSFRGIRPLFHFDALRLQGSAAVDGAEALCTINSNDLICMRAEVAWT